MKLHIEVHRASGMTLTCEVVKVRRVSDMAMAVVFVFEEDAVRFI